MTIERQDNARVIKFGDGMEQRQRTSLQRMTKTLSGMKFVGYNEEIDEIVDFFNEHGIVTPFYLDVESIGPKMLVRFDDKLIETLKGANRKEVVCKMIEVPR